MPQEPLQTILLMKIDNRQPRVSLPSVRDLNTYGVGA